MLFSVKITPKSKKNSVTVVSRARLRLEVKEEAKDNKANNQAVLLTLKHFKVASSSVKIIRGHHRPQKIVSVDNEGVLE